MLRIFSIIGLLVSVCIVGWFAATYFQAATSPMSIPAAVENGTGGSGTINAASPIEAARFLTSQDMERQKQIEELSK